jgi:SAM-dependent methyltransferase
MSTGTTGRAATRSPWRSIRLGRTSYLLFTAEFLSHAELSWRHDKPMWDSHLSPSIEAAAWDQHWLGLQHGLAGRLFSLYRRQIRSRCVARYLARYFPPHGLFAECGCGSGETSGRLGTDRTVIAVDFSRVALDQALRFPCYVGGVLADIRHLPFRDQSLDGLWNLGVMEHFDTDEQLQVLREFRRVVEPGGAALLWWPHSWGLDHLILRPFGQWFPHEPGRRNRSAMRSMCLLAGFQCVRVVCPWTDCGTEMLGIVEN